MLDYAATEPGLLRYEIGSENVYVPDGGHNVTDPSFPQQLWPYRADRVEAVEPPTTGVWRRHQVVYASPNASTVALGWECVTAGKPGIWKPITSSDGDQRRGGADELVTAIERLVQLHGVGALSEAEFSLGKAAVLAQYE
jgi:hypothetical protein